MARKDFIEHLTTLREAQIVFSEHSLYGSRILILQRRILRTSGTMEA
jgi:hypothetical protein